MVDAERGFALTIQLCRNNVEATQNGNDVAERVTFDEVWKRSEMGCLSKTSRPAARS